jgi:hypothetical protein
MKIVYIYASRSRPEKFFNRLDNIIELSVSDNFNIIAMLDTDDILMNNEIVKERLLDYPKVEAHYGFSTGKVNAINRGVSFIPEDTDIIIILSDDMVITQYAFDDIIRVDMQKYFPDLDGVLHYNDGSPIKDRVITFSILGYKYFKRFNYLYCHEYTSVWCDVEFTEVAKKLGKYKYIKGGSFFNHAHPLWIKEKYDDLMIRNESYYNSDQKVYFKRLANNFDL